MLCDANKTFVYKKSIVKNLGLWSNMLVLWQKPEFITKKQPA